ncbi:MAG: shikimate dehydrogenase [Ignavibacteriae bacterium]|nr:shikimate dehydrogenase [Ignavibacteriota bacterium]NOG98136.1 shikimate dehydrogenase [Ignavibacteriota bacterium]
MQSKFNFDSNTNIIGIIGHPIKQSLSPLMHNSSFRIANLNYIYLPFSVPAENLKDALTGMTALGIKGFNITIPLKEKIAQYLHNVSEEAGVIGAVNTVVNENGQLYGHNTDVHGIVESLISYKHQLEGEAVTVIGAGGAARSCIYALIRNFKVRQINIINRTSQIAESLKEYFDAKMHFKKFKTFELIPPDIVSVLNESKLIINSSSLGMFPSPDDSATTIEESFHDQQIVFDVVYNPMITKLLKIAKSRGATTINGLKMFVEQGAKSYEIWTGEKMPTDEIFTILQKYLKEDHDIFDISN